MFSSPAVVLPHFWYDQVVLLCAILIARLAEQRSEESPTCARHCLQSPSLYNKKLKGGFEHPNLMT
jgi:hypothetical protein